MHNTYISVENVHLFLVLLNIKTRNEHHLRALAADNNPPSVHDMTQETLPAVLMMPSADANIFTKMMAVRRSKQGRCSLINSQPTRRKSSPIRR